MPRLTVKLHRAQHDFCHSLSPYRGLVGGIGSGKSFAGAYDLIRRTKPGRLYMVAAPTYPMLKDASLRSFMDLAREFRCLKAMNRSNMIALLGNGAEVLFRSADDPERLRGPNISGIWLDEASLMHREAYEIAIGRLREKGEQGWLSATFTPKGRHHWTFDVFAKGGPGIELFHAKTKDNPFAPKGFADQLAIQYSGLLARQELEGEFVELEGAEWPSTYFEDRIWFDDWPTDSWACKTAALDPSKGKDAKSGDYAAFVLLAVDGEGTLWVEADLRRGQSAEALADQAVEWQRVFLPDAFAIETNQFQQLLAILIQLAARRANILVPAVEIDNRVNKLVRIRRLGPYLATGRVRFRNTPGTRLLVDQLREFPEGTWDDGPDSMEMCVRLASQMLANVGNEETVVMRA